MYVLSFLIQIVQAFLQKNMRENIALANICDFRRFMYSFGQFWTRSDGLAELKVGVCGAYQ